MYTHICIYIYIGVGSHTIYSLYLYNTMRTSSLEIPTAHRTEEEDERRCWTEISVTYTQLLVHVEITHYIYIAYMYTMIRAHRRSKCQLRIGPKRRTRGGFRLKRKRHIYFTTFTRKICTKYESYIHTILSVPRRSKCQLRIGPKRTTRGGFGRKRGVRLAALSTCRPCT